MQQREPVIATKKHTEKKARPPQPNHATKPTKKALLALLMTGVEALQDLEGGMSDGEAITTLRYGLKSALPGILAKAAHCSPEHAKEAIDTVIDRNETEAAKKS